MITPPLAVLVVSDERLARERLRSLLAAEPDVLIVGECTNGLDALAVITDRRPDVGFLDAQVTDLDGLGVIEALGTGDVPEIVLVTAHNTYMERTFELHAVDFLPRPFTDAQFASALANARRRVHARRSARAAQANEPPTGAVDRETERGLPSRDSAVLVALRDFRSDSRLAVRDARTGAWRIVDRESIDWIRTAGRGRVRVSVGGRPQTWSITISDLERRLDPRGWFRIHRSVIVNADRIREVKPLQKGEYAITLVDGTVFDSGRTYRAVVEGFLDLLRGGR